MKRAAKIACLIVATLSQSSSAWACPLCKFALETNEAEPRAYMISILFMMGTITALFSGVAGLLWWISRLETEKLTSAGYGHLFDNAGSHRMLAKVEAN